MGSRALWRVFPGDPVRHRKSEGGRLDQGRPPFFILDEGPRMNRKTRRADAVRTRRPLLGRARRAVRRSSVSSSARPGAAARAAAAPPLSRRAAALVRGDRRLAREIRDFLGGEDVTFPLALRRHGDAPRFPTGRPAGRTRHPARERQHLRAPRRASRESEGGPGRGQRPGHEPVPDHRALPPGHPFRRGARRLPGRPGDEAGPARAGRRRVRRRRPRPRPRFHYA